MCEVFGLTSLEAMSQGCPVLLSKSSSLPEINSDSADYFNPNDPNSIKDSMEKVLSNLKYRNDLVIKGNTHFKKFSWENALTSVLKNTMYPKNTGISANTIWPVLNNNPSMPLSTFSVFVIIS